MVPCWQRLWLTGAGVAYLEMAAMLPGLSDILGTASQLLLKQAGFCSEPALVLIPGGAVLQLLLLSWSPEICHFDLLKHTKIYLVYLSDISEYWNLLAEGEASQKLAHQRSLRKT